MAQDIRNMFRDDDNLDAGKLSQGHRDRFKSKLEKQLPAPRRSFSPMLKIAAMVLIVISIGAYFLLPQNNSSSNTKVVATPLNEVKTDKADNVNKVEKPFKLRDVSPQFKKVEDYYMASINVELANLTITKENKVLIDSFMQQLAQLDEEYKILNVEIEESGLNEQTVEAMISNLQFRLELLKKLKNKLNEIKNTKNKSYEDAKA